MVPTGESSVESVCGACPTGHDARMPLTKKQLQDLLHRLSVQADVPIRDVAERLAETVELDIRRGYRVEESAQLLKILKENFL